MRPHSAVPALLICLIAVAAVNLPAQDVFEGIGYITTPVAIRGGVLVSDNYGSAIFLSDAAGVREVVAGRGTGRYWTLSPDRTQIGYKRVLDDGSQVPELYDLRTATVHRLHVPVPLAGQVSFTADGTPAFMIGTTLILHRQGGDQPVEIGTYANIAPISPDGSSVTYADIRGTVTIRDLRSGNELEIAGGGLGHGFPAWSPDGSKVLYGDLAGNAFVFELRSGMTAALGQAYSPAWSPDGTTIVFSRKEIIGDQLVNSDLFLCNADGTGLQKITATSAVCEMDPSFDPEGTSIFCHTYDQRSVVSISLATGVARERVAPAALPFHFYQESAPLRKTTSLDIPYVHQVYDTPDWFNGHAACGPTTASMLLAYYRALPPWPGWCTTPGGHLNVWGRYVADRYRFRETDYVWQANDPNNRPAQGGYGYMWASGSPHSMMASYYQRHGISASTLDSPALQTAVDEVASGRPYSLCVDLTSAGHIVLAHGYEGNGTFVVNDPYGDKNRPGYPNYYGKNAVYDWPGWNNGHVNFGRYVYWAVSGSFQRPEVTDTLVDDRQIDTGFFLYNQAPVSMMSWKDANKGYSGHFWYTITHAGPAPDSCYATWTPNLPQPGAYEVLVYVPYSNATAARYRISTIAGQRAVEINQKAYRDTWVSLGTFDLTAGDAGMVRLGDSSATGGQELVFDAVRWSYRGPSTGVAREPVEAPSGFALMRNYPNPFNSSTSIMYQVSGVRLQESVAGSQSSVASWVKLGVYDILGREVAVLVNRQMRAGTYTEHFDAQALTSGTYIVRLTAGSIIQTLQVILLK